MIIQIIPSETCANLTAMHQSQSHSTIDMALLTIILAYTLCLNLAVVIVTIWSAELRGCLFSMQLAATYVGNILGGISLIGNDIHSSSFDILPICQKGVDYYSILYLGLSMNMVILLLNTRYRYVGISNINRMSTLRGVQTSRIVFKVWIPTGIISSILCAAATLIQIYIIDYQFLVSVGLCAPPLICSIIWNALLSQKLKIGRQNSKFLNREESLKVLDRASFIVKATILAHTVFLLICIIAAVCTLIFYENEGLVVTLSWLLRLMYLLLFTVEGHVYLSKVKPARDLLKKKVLNFLCPTDNEQDIIVDHEEEVTMQSTISLG